MKRILFVCMVAVLLFSVSALEEGDYTYTVADGAATVTAYTGSDAEVTVPATLGGYPVTAIGEEAFYNNMKLKKITVPSGVVSIGEKAFYQCRYLTEIDLPEGVHTIGSRAFSECFYYDYCTGTVDLPDSITTMGDAVFASCLYLKAVDLPDSLTVLGNSTFYSCITLDSIIFPEGLTEIGTGTFFTSSMRLRYLYIPKSVTVIGKNAFWQGEDLGVSLHTVGYGGSAEDFLSITFAEGNTKLLNHAIIFNASVCAFETNGGTAIDPIFTTAPIDALPVPTRAGSVFLGWYEEKDFLGETVRAPYHKSGSTTLYAKWATTTAEKMDFSGDSVLDIADALLGLRAVLNGTVTDTRDISGDGKFNLIDILRILRAIAG